MRIAINDARVSTLMDHIVKAGGEVRAVGGAVRDLLKGQAYKDIDLATNLRPEDVTDVFEQAGFAVVPTGLQHGTVTVIVDHEPFEITTLRSDISTDGRHAVVDFVNDFAVDAARRDFTINAMSADRSGKVYDYFDGANDLQIGRVKFVGNADERVQEDYLRILRYFRFRGRFGVVDDSASALAIRDHASGLERISVERVWREVSQILALPRTIVQLTSMETLGVTKVIGLPYTHAQAPLVAKLRQRTAEPAILLGAIIGDPDAAEALSYRWRLSSKERRQAIVAARTVADLSTDPHHWRVAQYDGGDTETLHAVLMATDRVQAARDLFDDIPAFPLHGRDLIAIGVRAGPGMGEMLQGLEDVWKTSEFKASTEDLLDLAKARMEPEGEATWRLK